VLVARHGPFTWGPTVLDAVENAVALELCAELAAIALGLGVTEAENSRPRSWPRHFNRKHGASAYYGQGK
jgi:L-ribulose-5-phosphate 4-epimerase